MSLKQKKIFATIAKTWQNSAINEYIPYRKLCICFQKYLNN